MKARSFAYVGTVDSFAGKLEVSRMGQTVYSIEEAWAICADLYLEILLVSGEGSLEQVEDEILFCLLGGYGVTYELCESAAILVSEMKPFSGHWSEEQLLAELISALDSARFEPPRRDGSLRRYRYPRRKAKLILQARRWVTKHSPIADVLKAAQDVRTRREFLCSCPGIGLKTASWVLRNTGTGAGVAILDTHIVRALQGERRIGEVRMPRDYERAERAFLRWCRELGAPPAAFDLFVWEWQRGSLRSQ